MHIVRSGTRLASMMSVVVEDFSEVPAVRPEVEQRSSFLLAATEPELGEVPTSLQRHRNHNAARWAFALVSHMPLLIFLAVADLRSEP